MIKFYSPEELNKISFNSADKKEKYKIQASMVKQFIDKSIEKEMPSCSVYDKCSDCLLRNHCNGHGSLNSKIDYAKKILKATLEKIMDQFEFDFD